MVQLKLGDFNMGMPKAPKSPPPPIQPPPLPDPNPVNPAVKKARAGQAMLNSSIRRSTLLTDAGGITGGGAGVKTLLGV